MLNFQLLAIEITELSIRLSKFQSRYTPYLGINKERSSGNLDETFEEPTILLYFDNLCSSS